jgi:multidrug transporter EmrE-like cation transporter
MNFIIGLFLGIVAQVLTYVQLQGQFKYEWIKEHPFTAALFGVPISLLYIGSVKYMVAHFDGNLWPSRLLGFSIGAIVFTFMSKFWFDEPFTLKTGICLALAACIMGIQIFWK